MKSKHLKISIFMLIISIFACGFLSWNNSIQSTYATDIDSQSCYYLVDNDGNPYKSNVEVGSVSGGGQFVVGHQNAVLTAIAYENYQLIGWHITYVEQENETQFINCFNLTDNKKTVNLTTKTGPEIAVDVAYTANSTYFIGGTFSLSTVFENLKVIPVFDHIYYQVNVNSLMNISSLSNAVSIGENTLYYSSSSVDDETTIYTDAIIKIGENYYFYGNLYFKNEKYFTIHTTLTNSPANIEVEYSKGAHRVGDEITIELDVDINSSNIKASKNIDMIGVLVDENA